MKKDFRKIKKNGGAAMLVSVVFFLFISLAIISGLVGPTVREFRNSSVDLNSKRSYFLAESGTEDAFYRIKNGMAIGTSETITLGSNSVTTDITNLSGNSKEIISLGDVGSLQRKTSLTLQTGAGVAFNYGLQAGNGGMTLDSSTIVGNVYANGSISAKDVSITGSAVAADSAALAPDQTNETPLPPTSSISFRNVSGSRDFAQSFQVSTADPLNKVQFYIRKVGSPTNATVRIVADNNGLPSTTNINIGTVSLVASQVTTSFGWVEVVFTTPRSVIPGTTYWVVIQNSTQNSSNYYVMGANAAYSSGEAKTGQYNGSWNATSQDGYFRIYTGGVTATIGRPGHNYYALQVGQSGVGNVWASHVASTSAAGSMYCLTQGTYVNKACNTSQGTPAPQSLPFSESNMDAWKADAEAGGVTSGNVAVGWQGATIGPRKITGNLTVSGGGTLTLTGPLWVLGDVTINGGGKVQLPANYGQLSETIISDGEITIAGGGSTGSGTSGSFLFMVSTSKCPNYVSCAGSNAINITGGAGAVAASAQYGNINLSGGASLKAVVGNSITMSGGTTVTYDSGLASPSFSSGPSGGWIMGNWSESE